MLNDESELSESEDAFINNIAIIIGNVFRIFKLIPKKFFLYLSLLSFPISVALSIFDYDKIKLSEIQISTFINSYNFYFLIWLIVISFIISLLKGFYNYINKSEKRFSEMQQDISKISASCKDKLDLLEGQNAAQPIFINQNLIHNMIIEIENYITLKENTGITDKYLPVLEIELRNDNIIEIPASKNGNPFIAERMIFEIWRQKQIRGSSVYDPYGLVSVYSHSEDSFKTILIDSFPEGDYWDDIISELKESTSKHVDDFYLKIYIPNDIIRTDKDTLNNLLTGLKQL